MLRNDCPARAAFGRPPVTRCPGEPGAWCRGSSATAVGLAARLLVGAGLLLATAARGGAAVWYVDAAAASAGDGTAAQPFRTLGDALARAGSGDELRVAAGVYSQTIPLEVNGILRAALLPLPAGVRVQGAGRGLTVLQAPASATDTYGITAQGVGNDTAVRDLTICGPCFQGVNLRGASPVLERVAVRTDVVGGSSTALDARDGSFPRAVDCEFDGGHSAVFVEFGSGGNFERCRLGSRPNETLAVIDSAPSLQLCVVEAGGRDTIVLAQGSQPILSGCTIGRGARWTVRVAGGYTLGTSVDLSGNRWGTRDPQVLAAAILDADDDPQLGARVEFLPLGDAVAAHALSMGALKFRGAGGARPVGRWGASVSRGPTAGPTAAASTGHGGP